MAFNPSMPFGHPGFGGLPSRWFGVGNPTSVSQQNFPTNVGGNMGMRSNPNDMMMGNRFGGLAQNPMPPQQPLNPFAGGASPGPQGYSQMSMGQPPQNVSAMMQQFAGPQGQFGQPAMAPPMSPNPMPQGMPGGAQMPQQAQGSPLMQALMQARMQPLR